MKKLILSALLILALLAAGCVKPAPYEEHLADYVKTLPYEDGFVILHLSDLHWGNSTEIQGAKEMLTGIIDETLAHKGHINLIVLTGDQFLTGNMKTVRTLIDTLESYGIPYAPVWGNHDQHGLYNPEWLSNEFRKAPHSQYVEFFDDLPGRSNYLIHLTEDGTKDTPVRWQLAFFDSGVGSIETTFTVSSSYGAISEEQAAWWKAEHDLVGEEVPVVAFYHVIEGDMVAASRAIQNGAELKNRFFLHEQFCNADAETSHFFDIAKNHGLRAAFFGHDHANDWVVDYEGVTLGYGVKSGYELYYTEITDTEAYTYGFQDGFDLTGAAVVTLHDGTEMELEHLYLNPQNDFTGWVVY